MGKFGTYYKGEKKKSKKSIVERKAVFLSRKQTNFLPKVEIFKKGKQ